MAAVRELGAMAWRRNGSTKGGGGGGGEIEDFNNGGARQIYMTRQQPCRAAERLTT